MKLPNRSIYAVVSVGLMMCIGLIYAWSVFVSPLEEEFGWTRTQTSLTFNICMTFFCIGGVVASYISSRKSPKFAIRIAAFLLLIGFVGASQVKSLIGLYFFYGAVCGTGVGFGYNIIFNVVTKWFADRCGLFSGITSMSFGLGGALLGSVATYAMGVMSWRVFFIGCGIVFFILTMFGSKWITIPPRSMRIGYDKGSHAETEINYTTKQMVRTSAFWIYFIWNMLANACGMAIIAHAMPVASEMGASIVIAALAMSISSMSRAVGGIIGGLLYDKFGYRFSMSTITGALIVGIVLMIISGKYSNVQILLVSFTLTGLGFGGSTANNTAILNEFFGRKHFDTNFSILNLCVIPGSFIGSTLVGIIRTDTGTYYPAFLLLLVVALLNLTCHIVLKRPSAHPSCLG